MRISLGSLLAGAMLLAALAGQAGRWFPIFDFTNVLAPTLLAVALTGALICVWTRSHVGSLIFLLAALLSGERIWLELRPAVSATAGSPQRVRVLSFNAWHGLRDTRLAASTILDSHADIVLLQEAGPLMAAERERLRVRYPYQSVCPDNRCELAILSRLPMERPRYRFRDSAGRAFGIGLLTARINLPSGGTVRVATLHLPRPVRAPRDAEMVRHKLAEAVGLLADPRLILGGDFNLVPWSFALQDLDTQLQPMRRLTRAAWSYPARLAEWQSVPMLPIDHVYAGPLWRLDRALVLPYAGSDHRPVMVDLTPLPRTS